MCYIDRERFILDLVRSLSQSQGLQFVAVPLRVYADFNSMARSRVIFMLGSKNNRIILRPYGSLRCTDNGALLEKESTHQRQ